MLSAELTLKWNKGTVTLQVPSPYSYRHPTATVTLQVPSPYRCRQPTGTITLQVPSPYRYCHPTGTVTLQLRSPYRYHHPTGASYQLVVWDLKISQTRRESTRMPYTNFDTTASLAQHHKTVASRLLNDTDHLHDG